VYLGGMFFPEKAIVQLDILYNEQLHLLLINTVYRFMLMFFAQRLFVLQWPSNGQLGRKESTNAESYFLVFGLTHGCVA
jgi:hypothetical protein